MRVPRLQKDRGRAEARLLLRYATSRVGTRQQREHQRTDTTVFTQRHGPRRTYPTAMQPPRRHPQQPPPQAPRLQDSKRSLLLTPRCRTSKLKVFLGFCVVFMSSALCLVQDTAAELEGHTCHTQIGEPHQ